MKFTIAAIATLASAASAHVIMSDPKQWDDSRGSGFNQYPLHSSVSAEGAAWPCGGLLQNDEIAATYTPGQDASLQLTGGATHGGGSAQMVITYDYPVTTDSVWRVMQSWEGNHPMPNSGENAANDASFRIPGPFSFKVPENLPGGKAVVAWSWNNHIGNPEHYMKCATVQIDSETTDEAGFLALPTMFQFNDDTPAGSQCSFSSIGAIKYKNPGPVVIGSGTDEFDCDMSEPGTGSSGSSGSGSSDSGSTDDQSNSDDSSAADETVPETPSTTTAASTEQTSVVEQPTAPTEVVAAPTVPVTDSTSNESSQTGACTEGAIKCSDDGTTYSLCGSSQWWDAMPLPSGSTCQNGAIVYGAAARKRDIRFSEAHKRHARRHSPISA